MTKSLQHAPFEAVTVNKLLGRGNPLVGILLYGNKTMFNSYMQQMSVTGTDDRHFWSNCQMKKECLACASVLFGPIRDLRRIVWVLRQGDPSLYCQVLQLCELAHMTYFCKEEYLRNTPPDRHWAINYVCCLVENVALQETSFDFALSREGLQTRTLLDVVSTTVSSFQQLTRGRTVFVESVPPKGRQVHLSHLVPMSNSPQALFHSFRGRTVAGQHKDAMLQKRATIGWFPKTKEIPRGPRDPSSTSAYAQVVQVQEQSTK